MRETKFKVWDKKNHKWFENWEIHICGRGEIYRCYNPKSPATDEYEPFVDLDRELEEEVEIVFYTGRKDKNDKEIYESDITKFPDGEVCKVEWVDTGFMLRKKNNRLMFLSPYNQWNEIIGNTFENPELFKEQPK